MMSKVTPCDLDVHLQSGDALVGAGHLEVHVAQVVFHAGDVGEHHVVVALFDEAHGDAGHRAGDRHAGVHQGEGGGADAGHGAGTVGFQGLRDQADGVGELLFIGDDRDERPLGEGAVTDLAPAGAAHEAGLAHAEGRELVVVHEALGLFDVQAVDALLVPGRAQGEQGEDLSLAAGEEAGAVRARSDAALRS